MSVQRINSINNKYNYRCKSCDDCVSSHVGKIAGCATGAVLGGGLVYSQMKELDTISGKKNLLERFYLDLKSPEDAPKRTIIRNSEGKIVLPVDGVHERSKIIAKSHKNYYKKWAVFLTAVTTGLGYLADRSITAVNKKEIAQKK